MDDCEALCLETFRKCTGYVFDLVDNNNYNTNGDCYLKKGGVMVMGVETKGLIAGKCRVTEQIERKRQSIR